MFYKKSKKFHAIFWGIFLSCVFDIVLHSEFKNTNTNTKNLGSWQQLDGKDMSFTRVVVRPTFI
jgi:hypothetical protein